MFNPQKYPTNMAQISFSRRIISVPEFNIEVQLNMPACSRTNTLSSIWISMTYLSIAKNCPTTLIYWLMNAVKHSILLSLYVT